MTRRVAVVTGANRGIGLGICRGLAKAGLEVILTSRDESKGREAQKQLGGEGLSVHYHQLDVTDQASVDRLTEHMAGTVGRWDVLVNNAGVLLDDDEIDTVLHTDIELIRTTLEANWFGAFRMCRAAVPMMRRAGYGRIVQLSSGLGQLSDMNGKYLAYRLTKAGLNVLTKTLAEEFQGTDILINSMCPGWVRTDMGGPNATRTIEQGADTALWLATLPSGGPRGGFFRDRKQIPW